MKIYFLFPIVILVCLNAILVYLKVTDKNPLQIKNDAQRIYHLNSSVILQAKYGSTIHIGDTVFDENSKYQQLRALITHPPVLVFRFTERNCEECIDFELPRLRSFAEKIGYDKVIVLATYSERNDFKIFKNKYLKGFNVYNIPYNQVNRNRVESLSMPYYFLLDSSFTGSLTFIPNKILPETTNAYFHEIENQIDKISSKAVLSGNKKSRIQFDTDIIKFDKPVAGSKLTANFKFRNLGVTPLVITLVNADCGCVIADYPHGVIKPGDKGVISLTYNNASKGYFVKSARVFSNTDTSPIVLNISGTSL